jgi:MarR family transcriptional regulator, negative regulator of the multidrug operon emrRAB
MTELLANWVGSLALAIDAQVTQAAAGHGGTTMGALLTCSYFPDMTVGELGEVLGLTGSGAVRLVDRLERNGLIARQAKQGRAVCVRLTAKGREVATDLQRRRVATISDLLAPLTEPERTCLAGILGKVLHDAGLSPEQARRACRLCDHRRCDGEACPVGRSLRERGEQARRAGAEGAA